MGRSLRSLRIPHLDQTEESDLHLLTRLGHKYDAIARPAPGVLILATRSEAVSASGLDMPKIEIYRTDAVRWRLALADRDEFRAVWANWRDAGAAGSVTEEAGSGEPVYVLRDLYPSSGEAREAARAKLAALMRSTRRLSITLGPGRPEATPEAVPALQGFRSGLDGRWICTQVTHRIDGSGYTTSAGAEASTA